MSVFCRKILLKNVRERERERERERVFGKIRNRRKRKIGDVKRVRNVRKLSL